MAGQFEDRTVFVTGAGSGFGRATALAFAGQGANVALGDIRLDRIRTVADECRQLGARAIPLAFDIGETAAVDEAFRTLVAELGGLDVMVNNAGHFAMPTHVADMTDELWGREVAVTLNGSFATASRAARLMIGQGRGGSILFTASISSVGASRGSSAYSACKAGIVALAKVMALELAPYAIRVNAVSPGPADTQRSVDFLGEDVMSRLRKEFPMVPLNCLASPDDVANAFLFLASDSAGYITGQNLLVDGGLSAQIYEAPRE